MLHLTESDRARLAGDAGDAVAMAMRVIVAMAEAQGASGLLDITGAHIDGCLYHGPVGLDFVDRLAAGGGRVAVPTTLNVTSLDLLHPELYRGSPETAAAARRQMDAYVGLGCRPTWTCAPYHLPDRPGLGEQIAWGESNAIAFANSVLGARTNRYGDFIDICAAVTARVPAVGLHLAENRLASIRFTLRGVSDELLASDVLYPTLGYLVGARAGGRVVAIDGLEDPSEDQLKALLAASAASGAVALVHVIGVTPEAVNGTSVVRSDAETVAVTAEDLRRAADELTTDHDGAIDTVSVGTPHASVRQLEAIARLLDGRSVASEIDAYVSVGRDTLAEVDPSIVEALGAARWQVVADTCTYITPIMRDPRVVMTDSGKWAFYAPGNIGVEVVFGSLAECVESAVAGRVIRDESLWR